MYTLYWITPLRLLFSASKAVIFARNKKNVESARRTTITATLHQTDLHGRVGRWKQPLTESHDSQATGNKILYGPFRLNAKWYPWYRYCSSMVVAELSSGNVYHP